MGQVGWAIGMLGPYRVLMDHRLMFHQFLLTFRSGAE